MELYLSQLKRYSKVCGSYYHSLIEGKLLNQRFLVIKLKSSLRKYYVRHHDLFNCYGVSVSQMTTWYGSFVVIIIRSFPQSWLIRSNTTGATSGAWTTTFSEHLCGVLYIIVYRFVLYCLAILLSVLRVTASNYQWYLQTFLQLQTWGPGGSMS